MERIEENAKMIVILLEHLMNKETNQEIKMSLNDLRIYHIAISDLIIYRSIYYKALTLMEKIKEWRTEKLNNYLYSTEEGKKILQSIMKLKLSLTKYIYCC